MSEKIYLTKVIAKEHGNYGGINISLHVDTLITFANQYKDERGYLRLKLSKRRVPGERFGDTHFLELDTWKPNGNNRTAPRDDSPEPEERPAPPSDDDVPFN